MGNVIIAVWIALIVLRVLTEDVLFAVNLLKYRVHQLFPIGNIKSVVRNCMTGGRTSRRCKKVVVSV